jgi:hypothetical protein
VRKAESSFGLTTVRTTTLSVGVDFRKGPTACGTKKRFCSALPHYTSSGQQIKVYYVHSLSAGWILFRSFRCERTPASQSGVLCSVQERASAVYYAPVNTHTSLSTARIHYANSRKCTCTKRRSLFLAAQLYNNAYLHANLSSPSLSELKSRRLHADGHSRYKLFFAPHTLCTPQMDVYSSSSL